jgi:hypothetical protein
MTQIRGKTVERVGVLVVHGIGEQRRFEHLESEARKIINAILAIYGRRRCDVTVTLASGESDSFHGDQSSWVSGADAPLHALVDFNDKVVDVAFHEVWWADVNERLTLGKQVRFWLWGLSVSGVVLHTKNESLSANKLVAPANAGRFPLLHRLRLFHISTSFGLSAFSIALVNALLQRLDFAPLPFTRITVNYLSGVKLYSQHKRTGGGPMDGPDEPPRYAICRRMVRAIVDVATAEYDRWYILAHSLGSIVAWNGIMADEEMLPNYLDEVRWKRVQAMAGLAGTSQKIIQINEMMPSRPIWLGTRETIARKVLFEKFCGILTYGCPLERFGELWPAMVMINPDQPFPPQAEWINVYDPTDPVGTWISSFELPVEETETDSRKGLTVNNFPCRASPILLLSHVCYLTVSRLWSLRLVPNTRDLLVNRVAEWLVQGASLAEQLRNANRQGRSFWMPLQPQSNRPGWQAKARIVWKFVQWGISDFMLTTLALLSLHYIVYPIIKGVSVHDLSGHTPSQVIMETVLVWAFVALAVLMASLLHYGLESRDLRDLKRRINEQKEKPLARNAS